MSAGGDRVAVQGVLGHVVLGVDDVFDALVVFVLRVDREKDVVAGFRILAEGRHQGGLVGVADVVLAAVGHVAVPAQGGEHHLGGVEVGAVGFFGQAEGEYAPFVEEPGGLFFDRLVVAHPDGSQAQDGHLPGVPVGQPVEAEDFVEVAVALGVPANVRVSPAVCGWCQQGGKDLVFLNEFDKVGVPDPLMVVLLELGLAFVFEKGDGFFHDIPRPGIEVGKCFFLWVQ